MEISRWILAGFRFDGEEEVRHKRVDAVFGTGFWSHYQIAAWNEVGGVELVALYNRTVSKAQKVAEKFGIPRVYGDPEDLLRNEQLDFKI
jgi:predicted dehydrogenase